MKPSPFVIPQRSETIRHEMKEATNSRHPTSSGLLPKLLHPPAERCCPVVPTFVSRASYQAESRSKSSAVPLLFPQTKSLGGHTCLRPSPQKGCWRSGQLYSNTGLLQTLKRGKMSHVRALEHAAANAACDSTEKPRGNRGFRLGAARISPRAVMALRASCSTFWGGGGSTTKL